MPVMDEFREERDAMKQKSYKERLQYFWDYYKWHVICGAALAAFVISLIHNAVARKDYAFYGAFINSFQTASCEDFREDFAARAGIDLNRLDIIFDSNMFISDKPYDTANVDVAQRLMVYIAAGDLDVMASGPTIINRYAYNDTFQDLRQILPPELQAQLEPYYYYMDAALAAEFEAQQATGEPMPDPRYPATPSDRESLREPIPVGLYIQDCPLIQESFIFQENEVILGVAGNAGETDTILQFIRMIYGIEG